MALVLADRVKETTTTTGTGMVTLLGASTGFQSFAVIGNANTTYYTIASQTGGQWEVRMAHLVQHYLVPQCWLIAQVHSLRHWIYQPVQKMCL